jgi:DNA polymerase-3 subunit delta
LAKKNFEKFQQAMGKKKFARVYLFSGPQEDLKREAMKILTAALLPLGSESFNLDKREASQIEIAELSNLVSTLPWGASKRIVVLSGVDELQLEQRHQLAELIEKVPETTCLVLTAEKLPESEVLFKAIDKNGEVIEFSTLREEKLIERIEELVQRQGKSITPPAANKLAMAIGSDLYGLEQEMEKLVTFIGEKKSITEEEVEQLISASPEYKVYELIEQIARGEVQKSIEIVREVLFTQKYAGIITNQLLQDFFFLWRIFTYAGSRNDFKGITAHLGLGRQAFRVSKYLNCSRNYNQEKVEQSLRKITEADRALRYNPLSPEFLIEQLVVELCRIALVKGAVPTTAKI